MLAAAPPHYLLLPISLNSLDLAGVRLLSPRDSPDTITTVAGADDHDARAMLLVWSSSSASSIRG